MDGVELILMDASFGRLRAVRAFHSLRWVRRYYEDGAFELRLPSRFLPDARKTAYVYRKDSPETGLVTHFKKDGDEITLKGAFLEELLKTRVLEAETAFEGEAHEVCRQIVGLACVSPSSRALFKLELGDYVKAGRSVSYTQRGKTVYDALRDILTEREASFRLRYDIYADKVFFDIYKGVDRTTAQTENSWCVFSDEYHNVLSESYENRLDTRNVAYVAGSRRDGGASSQETVWTLELDARTLNESGETSETRRELYVDARDIVKTAQMSENEFISLLRERGHQKLADFGGGESVECEVDASKMANMAFALGDKCLYRGSELGVEAEGRVTEIEETIENGEVSSRIILGGGRLDLVRKILNR